MSVSAHPLSAGPAPMSLAAYWELLVNLTRREIKARYSQTLFGVAWAVAQPLATMAVFTLVFSRLARIPSEGMPYALFAFAALVPWFFFSNSVMSGTASLVVYRNIVTKTYFPREIIPLAQVSARLVDFAAAASVYALMMVYYVVPIGRWAWMAPLLLLLLLLFTCGVTLATSALNVFYRDVGPVIQIGLQLWLYLTPIAYPLSIVPERYRWILALNPLTALIEGLRAVLLFDRAPDWQLLAPAAAIMAAIVVGAYVLFKRLDRYFADVI